MTLESEKPFGNYPTADYNFFAAMNDKIVMQKTPLEEKETSILIREIYADISSENENKYLKLIEKIKNEDGIEVKAASGEENEKLFVLTSEPIHFAVIQGERRTKILFQINPQIRYVPNYFYDLFFDEIPKALYGRGRDAPIPSHLKESTIVSTLDKKNKEDQYDLQKISDKERFEIKMQDADKIDCVKFSCEGLGVSYSVLFPNPKNTEHNYIQFSFPSSIKLKNEVVNILFDIHRDAGRINSENQSYARAFTSAINKIREELRVR